MRADWYQTAMAIARAITIRSEDPYVKVGACILRRDHSVASVGFNGAPPDVDIDWSNRELRRTKVIHAETNALRYIRPKEGWLIAVTLLPCPECLKNIASYQIPVVAYGDVSPNYDSKTVFDLALEFNITMVQIK